MAFKCNTKTFQYKNIYFSTKIFISVQKNLFQYKNIYFSTKVKVSQPKYKHIPSVFATRHVRMYKKKRSHTVKSHFKAVRLCNFIRGFGWAYKRGRLVSGWAYKRGGLVSGWAYKRGGLVSGWAYKRGGLVSGWDYKRNKNCFGTMR